MTTRIETTHSEPRLTSVAIDLLLLDSSNPRLRERTDNSSQIDLATEIAQHYDALGLARMISHNGFYTNSALLAYPTGDGRFVVAEGNRRLTAVLGLTRSEFRNAFPQRQEWNRIAELPRARALSSLPVYIFEEPSALRPILAAEHLNRKLSWEPFQKAREIVNLVDVEGYSFEDIAEISGIPKNDIKSMYRDFKLTKFLSKAGFSELVLTSDFSKVGEVTRIASLGEYCGLPSLRELNAGHLRLDEDKKQSLLEIFDFVFGEDSVTPDSRQIRELAKVVTEEESLNHLRIHRDLSEAMEVYKLKTENNIESTMKSLTRIVDQLERLYSKVLRDKENALFDSLLPKLRLITKKYSEL